MAGELTIRFVCSFGVPLVHITEGTYSRHERTVQCIMSRAGPQAIPE